MFQQVLAAGVLDFWQMVWWTRHTRGARICGTELGVVPAEEE